MTEPEPEMDILLINLDRAPERLHFQRTQFSLLNVNMTRVRGIDGASLDENYYRKVRATGARVLMRNEVACTLSHAACWRHAVERHKPVLVLEDDAVLDPCFGTIVRELGSVAISENLYINLEYFGTEKTIGSHYGKFHDGRFSLDELIKSGGGAAGYIITPDIAGRLLALSRRNLYIADTIVNLMPDVCYAQLSPAIVAQLGFVQTAEKSLLTASRSTIVGEKQVRPSSMESFVANPMTRFRRLLSNVVGWRRRFMALARSRRVSVAPRPELHQSLRMVSQEIEKSSPGD